MAETQASLVTIKATLGTTQATLNATKATLDSARDTSSMKIIAILTAIFLPFTFMAVREPLFSAFNKLTNLPGSPHNTDVQMARSS